MGPSATETQPSLDRIWDNINAFQRSAALRAAIKLNVFTAIAHGDTTTAGLAAACGASERGIRILCDFLVVAGLLTKTGPAYGNSPEAQAYLVRESPAYLGSSIDFMLMPSLIEAFDTTTEAVRLGTTQLQQDSMSTENPMWRTFAEAMGPMMRMPAANMAEKLAGSGPLKVLDIAAGHGRFGIAFAQANPQAEVTAVDWAGVLEVAVDNAREAGVADRYRIVPGSAFDVDFGSGYDIVLLTNFLHHFDPATNHRLLGKVRSALGPGGKVVTLEFVPHDDRVTPAGAAAFSLTMLVTTRHGDAYTSAELTTMLEGAGFSRNKVIPLLPSPQTLIVSSVD